MKNIWMLFTLFSFPVPTQINYHTVELFRNGKLNVRDRKMVIYLVHFVLCIFYILDD